MCCECHGGRRLLDVAAIPNYWIARVDSSGETKASGDRYAVTARTRHSPKQIVNKLDTAAKMLSTGAGIATVCCELGISEATYHRWRKTFGGLTVELAEQLTDLLNENRILRKQLAEAELKVVALRAIAQRELSDTDLRRMSVRHLQETLGVSERFACRVTGQHRSTQRRPQESL